MYSWKPSRKLAHDPGQKRALRTEAEQPHCQVELQQGEPRTARSQPRGATLARVSACRRSSTIAARAALRGLQVSSGLLPECLQAVSQRHQQRADPSAKGELPLGMAQAVVGLEQE